MEHNPLYRIAQNFDGGHFDGFRLFKYLMENMLTDDHCLSPYNCKFCIVFKQFDRLNFDGLAGKRQKCQNFPHQNFALYGSFCTDNCKLYAAATVHFL